MKFMNSFKGKWMADKQSFREACIAISKDLTGFKRNPAYFSHIGNDIRNQATASAFYNYIAKHYPLLLFPMHFDEFLKNDLIGNPIIHRIADWKVSAGTLRFIKVLGDIIDMNQDPKTIIEIGSGYGGQCKIIKDLWQDVDYTLVDIPESLGVAKAYLKALHVEANFVAADNLKLEDGYDLVISDYCLSELDEKGIDFYFDTIISKCKSAYLTVNMNAHYQHIINRLEDLFATVHMQAETPKTTRHENYTIRCINSINYE